MFQKLQDKWKVKGIDLFFILLTFAVGGSLCGIAGKKIMNLIGLEKGIGWFIIYIIVLTLIWPLCVLLISIPLGKFYFFKTYISKIFARMSGKGNTELFTSSTAEQSNPGGRQQINLAIFASGAGSNAARIIEHFKDNPAIHVALIVCNKPGAGVLKIAADQQIPVLLIEKERFYNGDAYVNELKKYPIDWIILAGFLWKVPSLLIKEWSGYIINIHPALLPNYGGKGMYGRYVHEAVIAAGDKLSGISIHYVDEIYDHGEVIMQAYCDIAADDTPESLAQKIHQLEHDHFPKVIETEILKAKNALNQNRKSGF